MKNTLVIGANGQIGRLFCQLAAENNIPIKAMIRNEGQQSYFEELGVITVIADLEGDFSAAFEDCDRVIFTAGSGGHTGADKTIMIDLYAAVRAIELSQEFNIKQFIMVSALRAEAPLTAPEKLRPYMVAKLMADDKLINSSVPHTVLRPGRLIDEPATRRIRIPSAAERDPITISRANVAESIIAVLGKEQHLNQVYDLLDGDEAIESCLA